MSQGLEEKTKALLAAEDAADALSVKIEAFLDSLPRFTKKHTTYQTRAFLDAMGSPDENMRIIHVAGTNGKGSVCAFLSSMLQAAGYKTGMFTSPHLVRITERFRLNGEEVLDADFCEAFRAVARVQLAGGFDYPTYFEFLFFMAMALYRQRPVDFLILETGLGGRLDATNTVRKPLICVITEIGLDHMQYLGNTIEEIAGEKAGIIKEGVPVVYANHRKESSEVIVRTASEKGSKAFGISPQNLRNVQVSKDSQGKIGIDFCYVNRYDELDPFFLPGPAAYQLENLALALKTLEVLTEYGQQKEIPVDLLDKGIRAMRWPGRMQEISPSFYIDGAHNMDGIRAFIESAGTIPCKGRRLLLFSAVSDKQYEAMLEALLISGLFTCLFLTRLQTDRTLDRDRMERLYEQAKHSGIQVVLCKDVQEALKTMQGERGPKDTSFAAGSLYLVSEVLKITGAQSND